MKENIFRKCKALWNRPVRGRRAFFGLSGGGGAMAFGFMYLFCLLYTSSFSIMGVRAGGIEDLVFARFKGIIFISQLKILALYLALGLFFGLSMGAVLWFVSPMRRRPMRAGAVAVAGALYALAAALVFLMADIMKHPALYNEHFYARGPVRAAIQMFITHGLPRPVPGLLKGVVRAPALLLLANILIAVGRGAFNLYQRLPRYGRALGWGSLVILAAAGTLPWGGNTGPNIVLISADSFRHDRVSRWGVRPGLTPRLDALAEEGVSFHDFHVQLPRTFPSWYCLLSGRYPVEHGIRHMFPTSREIASAEAPLPGILRARGYVTSAAADYAGDIFSRMNFFDRRRVPSFNFTTLIKQRGLEIHFLLLPFLQNSHGRRLFPELLAFAQNSDPRFLVDEVTDELEYLKTRKKFFLTIFLSATHFPYATPDPYYKKFTDPSYRGEYRYLKINDPTRETRVTTADRRQIRALYDGACGAVDDAVGEIIDCLKSRGLYENSIVLFTADHGENLYDRGLDLGHGEHFRGDFVTRVPLIVKFHDAYREKVAIKDYHGLLRQVDLAPTLLEALGIDDGGRFSGESFTAPLEGRADAASRIGFAETGIWFVDRGEQFFQKQRILYPDVSVLCGLEMPGYTIALKEEYRELITIAKHRTVFDRDYKLVYIPTRDGVHYELYRRADMEFNNLYYPGHPEAVRLRVWLEKFMREREKARVVNHLYIPCPGGVHGSEKTGP